MKKLLNKGIISGAVALLALAGGAAHAATATANFQVTATVNASCTLSVTPMAFGALTPAASGDATATAKITATCSNGSGYTLSLNKGSGDSITDRSMAGTADNTDKLKYNIYREAGASTVFGDGTSGQTIAKTGNGVAQDETVYGKLALNQYIKADSYSDNLTVTLSY